MKALHTITFLAAAAVLALVASLAVHAQQPVSGGQRGPAAFTFTVPDDEMVTPVANVSRDRDVVVTNTGKREKGDSGAPVRSESDPYVVVFVRNAEGQVVAGPIEVRLGSATSVGVPKGGSVEVHDEDPGAGDEDSATLTFAFL